MIESPVHAFVALEHYNAIRLVQLIHNSLRNLNKVIKGTMLLSANVQKLGNSLLKNQVSDDTLPSIGDSYLCRFDRIFNGKSADYLSSLVKEGEANILYRFKVNIMHYWNI